MNKVIFFLLIPLFLIVSNPVKADVLEWQQKSQEIQQQREELKRQLVEIEGLPSKENEEAREANVKIIIQDNELAAMQEAYEKAINFNQGQSFQGGNFPNFSPAKLQPGEAVPSEYIPIYKAAGEKYGVDWYVLASIHSIETSFSNHTSMLSSAGAIGHMQFMPATFRAYGVDGNGDGQVNAWNLEDAIFSAANYLRANNYQNDIRKAIWHYNHSEAYVNKVIETAWRFKG
jgi:membrane-bound lytic murein transglycosylase B